MTKQEQEINELYLVEMRYELNLRMRSALVEWAREIGGCFFFTAESASRGYWDDVVRDADRGKVTPTQAKQIIDKCFEFGLINQRQAKCYTERTKR